MEDVKILKGRTLVRIVKERNTGAGRDSEAAGRAGT